MSTVGEIGDDVRPRTALAGLGSRSLLSLAGSGVSAVAGVLVVVAITRTMPMDAAGIFFTLTSLFLLAEIVARLGSGTGLVWAISRARALDLTGRLPALMKVAFTPVAALSLLTALAVFAAADPLAALVLDDPDHVSTAGTALRALAVLLPFATMSNVVLAATRGHDTVLPTVALERLGRPTLQLGAVVAAATTGSVALLAAAWALPWAVSAAVGLWWLRRLQRPVAPARSGEPARPSREIWREFWSFTAPRAVTSVVQLALQRLDIVLLTVLAGPAEAAVYTAATRFLVAGQFVNQALSNVVEPRIGGLLALQDRAGAGAVWRTSTAWLVLVTWPLWLLVAAHAEGFLRLFGSDYAMGVPAVLVLAGTMLVASGIGLVDVVLIMGGRTRWNLGNSIVALAVNVVIDLLLIPPLGLLGAAIGWSAAILTNNLLPLAQVHASLHLNPFDRVTGLAMLLTATTLGAVPLALRTVLPDGAVATLAATLAGAVLFVLGCWRWRNELALGELVPRRRR